MRNLVWVTLLILSSCSSLVKRVSPNTDRSLLFPHGTYTHDVVVKTKGGDAFSFRAMVKITKEEVIVVGISPFQTTLFQLTEDRLKGTITAEIYQEAMRPQRDSIVDFYSSLATFLTLPKKGIARHTQVHERNTDGLPVGVSVTKGSLETRIHIRKFDDNAIPDVVEIFDPRFLVTVKVVSYET